MKIINLCGGPGAGKTTTALSLTAKLKRAGREAEFVPECAREMTFDGKIAGTPQFDIMEEQFKRLWRLIGTGIEFAVTDSPLLLQLAYTVDKAQRERIKWASGCFDNHFYFIDNDRENHSMVGRSQTREEAMIIDQNILKALPYYTRFPKDTAARNIALELLGPAT